MNIHQSELYAKYIQTIGWVVEKAGETNVFVRKIGPTAVIKIQRPDGLDLPELKNLEKKYHPLLIKIEPNTGYKILDTNYISDNWPLLPTKTIVLKLKSEISDLSSLPKDTRYEIRKTEERGLTIAESRDIDLFYELLQETMKIGGWAIPIKKEVTNLYKSFQPNNSVLLFATVNREPISTVNPPVAACLLIWDGNTAHYMYAALTKRGRELGAAYFLLWNAIKFCQAKKLKYLDLEGIYDDRFPKLTKNWQGFTKFKKGWNGTETEYPGSYTKYANQFIKLIFSLA